MGYAPNGGGPATGDAVDVPRLLVLWSRPHHLSAAEAERWVRAEVRALRAVDAGPVQGS